MRGQEVCVCVCVCPSAAAAEKPLGFEPLGFEPLGFEPLGFQLHPLFLQSIFDRGFRFSSPCELAVLLQPENVK